MFDLRHHSANLEITLALAGAFGMIIMALNPVMGQVMMGGSLSLLFILYLLFGVSPRDIEAASHFQEILNRINFLVAACADILLLVMLVFLPGKLALALPAIVLLAVCLALNAAHRYIYRIREAGYYAHQVRLLILAGLLVMVLLPGGH